MTLHDQVSPELKRIQEEIDKLNHMKLHIGIQGGVAIGEKDNKPVKVDAPATVLTIAGVHEFEMTIHATNVKNLTVPVSHDSKGKRAGDFQGLFVYSAADGKRYLARPKGKKGVQLLFWLTPSVTIPERSFLRAGYDNHKAIICGEQMMAL